MKRSNKLNMPHNRGNGYDIAILFRKGSAPTYPGSPCTCAFIRNTHTLQIDVFSRDTPTHVPNAERASSRTPTPISSYHPHHGSPIPRAIGRREYPAVDRLILSHASAASESAGAFRATHIALTEVSPRYVLTTPTSFQNVSGSISPPLVHEVRTARLC